MILKPQDILILLKLVVMRDGNWSYATLASDLGMSQSEIHAGLKRACRARLADASGDVIRPLIPALESFLFNGLAYVFVPDHGQLTRGMPTALFAPPLRHLAAKSDGAVPVWPDAEGDMEGYGLSPLYRSAPVAARRDARLYRMLALVDVLRDGREHERRVARNELSRHLHAYRADG